MRTFAAKVIAVLASGLLAAVWSVPAAGQVPAGLPEEVRGLDIVEKPGSGLPLDLELINSDGEPVRLRDLFRGRPVVLALVYYDCPVACQAVMTKMAQSFRDLDYAIGRQYDVVMVSFDPTNTPLMAAAKKAEIFLEYERDDAGARDAWSFLVTSDTNARAIADAVGFMYRFVPDTGEYAHPTGIFVLTPEGRLSRTFYGFDYPPTQLKLALLEASDGKIARSWGETLLLFCYHYDPKKGSYSLAAFRVMQAGAVATMVLLGALIVTLRVAERARRARAARETGMTRAGLETGPTRTARIAGVGQH